MRSSVRLLLHGTKCSSCLAAVEQALLKEHGVETVEIDPDSKTARIEADMPVTGILAAIRAAGYDASVL